MTTDTSPCSPEEFWGDEGTRSAPLAPSEPDPAPETVRPPTDPAAAQDGRTTARFDVADLRSCIDRLSKRALAAEIERDALAARVARVETVVEFPRVTMSSAHGPLTYVRVDDLRAALADPEPAQVQQADEVRDGCDCTELCEMGPTCPGGGLAGLAGSGCWRTLPPPEGCTGFPDAIGNAEQSPVVRIPDGLAAFFERTRCPECGCINNQHDDHCVRGEALVGPSQDTIIRDFMAETDSEGGAS